MAATKQKGLVNKINFGYNSLKLFNDQILAFIEADVPEPSQADFYINRIKKESEAFELNFDKLLEIADDISEFSVLGLQFKELATRLESKLIEFKGKLSIPDEHNVVINKNIKGGSESMEDKSHESLNSDGNASNNPNDVIIVNPSTPFASGEDNDVEQKQAFVNPDNLKNSNTERNVKETDIGIINKQIPAPINHQNEFHRIMPATPFPKFEGDVERWPTFVKQFESAINNYEPMSSVQKVLHLRDSLKYPAAIRIIDSFSDECFDDSWSALKKKFYDPNAIQLRLISRLLDLPEIKQPLEKNLNALSEQCSIAVQSLDSLDIKMDKMSNLLLTSLILRKLDAESRYEWQLSHDEKEIPDLNVLLAFVSKRAKRIKFKELNHSAIKSKPVSFHVNPGDQRREKICCKICNNLHHPSKCPTFVQASTEVRWNLARRHQLCFNCLGDHSNNWRCLSKYTCFKCKRRHHTLLHRDEISHQPNERQNQAKETCFSAHYQSTPSSNHDQVITLLNTAIINVLDGNGNYQKCRAFIDSGSVPNFISEKCLKRLSLNAIPHSQGICGIGGMTSHCVNGATCLRFGPHFSHKQPFSAKAYVLKNITSSLPLAMFDATCMQKFFELKLADKEFFKPAEIDILLGQDLISSISVNEARFHKLGEAYALETKLGYLIGGRVPQDKTLAISNFVGVCSQMRLPTFALRPTQASFKKGNYDVDKGLAGDIIAARNNLFANEFLVNFSSHIMDAGSNHVVLDDLNTSDDLLIHKETQRDLDILWRMDEVKAVDKMSSNERHCEEHFMQTHKRNSQGRYLVKLPFKSAPNVLGNSRSRALQQFYVLERRLNRQPLLKSMYHDFMKEYLRLGHMESVESRQIFKNESYYLPHHGVVKESSSTTKLRVVFNASSKTTTVISLNEILEVGPVVQGTLSNLIIRFRSYCVAFTADIEKMYRQISIIPKHADFQRIVWRFMPTEPVQDFRLTTVTYGTASAAYLVTRALNQVAIDEGKIDLDAKRRILNDFYVDDLLSGASSIPEARRIVDAIKFILAKGGFPIRKWSSNKPECLQHLLDSDLSIVHVNADDEIVNKTLGIIWDPKGDVFGFKIKLHCTPVKLTKREILSRLASIYDPIGWLAPVILPCKLILQRLWRLSGGWDDPIPSPFASEWSKIYAELPDMERIKLPRWYRTTDEALLELHGFADASEKAYAGVVYLRVITHNGAHVSLIAAKTRVASLKIMTLPRLELCAALLTANLLKAVSLTLGLSSGNIKAWSDSSIALAWINSYPAQWKTYVANRVAAIQENFPASCWNHVPGHDNPADVASRGILSSQLYGHPLWWTGPSWLSTKLQSPYPKLKVDRQKSQVDVEARVVSAHVDVKASYPELDMFLRFSNWVTLVRSWAYCRRFMLRIKPKPLKGSTLSVLEVRESKLHIIKTVQSLVFKGEIEQLRRRESLKECNSLVGLRPFIDDEGILRVGGRIKNAQLSYERKHQVILPKAHEISILIARHIHKQALHAGPQQCVFLLRQEFWIPSAQNLMKFIIKECIECRKFKLRFQTPIMADLPASRVTPSFPFYNVGTDFAGPFVLKPMYGRKNISFKVYIAIFVCFSTKALHLEVVNDLSTTAFLNCLKRFIGRRGKPNSIHSDCGTNFAGARRKLHEMDVLLRKSENARSVVDFCSMEMIKWSFNPPAAPHFGGVWEAGVKRVKYHLKRVMGNSRFNWVEFETLLIQIESILNSRPLTPNSNDPDDLSALTPGHFIIGRPLTTLPSADLSDIPLNSVTKIQLVDKTLQMFWKRWSKEYLNRLQTRPKWKVPKVNLKINDLVVIKDENTSPLHWCRGRILQVFPSSDGIVRSALVRTQKGQLHRPSAKLALLFEQPISET